MTRRLIQKMIDGTSVYIWYENNERISPLEGHASLDEAERWIHRVRPYTGPERRFRPLERRWRERRRRTSIHERRQSEGRRAIDQIRGFRKRGL